jgi:VWFA-related protein
MSRRSPHLYAVAALLMLLLAGCAATSRTAPAANASSSGPERFCADAPATVAPILPQALSATPGFTEFSAAVTDPNGKPLVGLTQSDFRASTHAGLLPIVWFEEAPAVPVTLGIQPKLDIVRTVMVHLLARVDACDEFFMFAFSSRPFMLQPLTTDHALAASRLHLLHAFGQTSLYDSVLDGLDMVRHGHYTRKALLVLTDGIDSTSQATLKEVTAVARQHGVPIYAIGIGDPDPHGVWNSVFMDHDLSKVDVKALNQLADAAGGQTYIVSIEGNGLADAVASIEAHFKPAYTIGLVMLAAGTSSTPPPAAITATPPVNSSTPPAAEPAGASQPSVPAATTPSASATTLPVRLTVAGHPNAVVTTRVISDNPPRP